MKNRKPEMSENDGRDILAHRLVEFQKNTTRYFGSKIGISTKSLRLSALNATDREAFGSELGGRQKTVMCRYWFLAELTTPIAGDGRA
ncbi:MAG: hypothetical protein QOG92_1970 [Verrucomicrobiota bacterium]|jgi:hypothetical protein|nr:hypothetical protein [Verrucomicrobiota bacterium]